MESLKKSEDPRRQTCPTCGPSGFPSSVLGLDRCTFCDGTEGGHPPTLEDLTQRPPTP